MMKQNLSLDFVLSFCQDKIPGQGEDSYCYSFCDTAGMLGVFDGCGGAGARRHGYYSDHTEAYMASRLCAGAFYDCFRRLFPTYMSPARLVSEAFGPHVMRRLKDYSPPRDETGFQIKGAGIRTLPSTAAVALVQQDKGGDLLVTAIWAGDSRVYLLDSKGLAQLTEDDTTVPDPMQTLYDDGVLKNVLCSDKPVQLHHRTVRMQEPFVVFAATDGCFGYLSTPMEFEGVLLDTLLRADCAAAWEEKLAALIGSIAGDDQSLCLAAYGFGSFTVLQKTFAGRYIRLQQEYLTPVAALPLQDLDSRKALWNGYKDNYLRWIKDGMA